MNITGCPCANTKPKGPYSMIRGIPSIRTRSGKVYFIEKSRIPVVSTTLFNELIPPKGVACLSEYSIGRLTIWVNVLLYSKITFLDTYLK
ncbi:hypothetical protein MNBD_BACTEROID03-1720 [hydrothermal vent metagenome]|uniref:Uncharacterized protein n=1 Tax=hydrothermal vent metagenome TaxID=652676 RepID=A0A3B0TSU8_9ZZZZ